MTEFQKQAYENGKTAAFEGRSRKDNPFWKNGKHTNRSCYDLWDSGFFGAAHEAMNAKIEASLTANGIKVTK